MYEVTIGNIKTGAIHTFVAQSVGMAVLKAYRGWPQFEIWSRAGGGSWCRSLYRLNGRRYDYVRTDEFTELDSKSVDKSRMARIPGDEDMRLYFVETRLPESN
jgi:hypothetical protein